MSGNITLDVCVSVKDLIEHFKKWENGNLPFFALGEALEEGFCVRRKAWDDGLFIRLVRTDEQLFIGMASNNGFSWEWRATSEDLMAKDWVAI